MTDVFIHAGQFCLKVEYGGSSLTLQKCPFVWRQVQRPVRLNWDCHRQEAYGKTFRICDIPSKLCMCCINIDIIDCKCACTHSQPIQMVTMSIDHVSEGGSTFAATMTNGSKHVS